MLKASARRVCGGVSAIIGVALFACSSAAPTSTPVPATATPTVPPTATATYTPTPAPSPTSAIPTGERIAQLVGQVIEAYVAGDFETALEVVEQALAVDDSYAVLHGLKGQILFKGFGELEESLTYLDAAIQLDRFDPSYELVAGDVLWAMGRPGDARLRVNRAALLGANSTAVNHRVAFYYADLGDLGQAETFATHANLGAETDEEWTDGTHALAYVYYLTDGYSGAQRFYEAILEIDPDDVRAQLGRAISLAEQGDSQGAASVAEVARSQLEQMGPRLSVMLAIDPYLSELVTLTDELIPRT